MNRIYFFILINYDSIRDPIDTNCAISIKKKNTDLAQKDAVY